MDITGNDFMNVERNSKIWNGNDQFIKRSVSVVGKRGWNSGFTGMGKRSVEETATTDDEDSEEGRKITSSSRIL